MSFSVLVGCSTVFSTLTSFLVGNFISFSDSGTVLEYADSTSLGLFSKFSNLGISLPPNFLYSRYLSMFSCCLPLSNNFSNEYLVDSNFAFNFSSSLTLTVSSVGIVVSSSTVTSLGDTTSKSSTVLGLSTLATTISLAKGLSSFGIDLTTSCTSVLGTTLSTTFFLGSFFLVSVFLGVVFSVVSVVVVSTFGVFSGSVVVVVVSTCSLFTVKGCTISFIVSPFSLTLVVFASSFNAKGFTISFVVYSFLLTLVVSVLGFLTLDLSI